MNRFHTDFDPAKLDLVIRAEDAIIFHGDTIFKTPKGNDLCHTNLRLLKHIITDLQIAKTKSQDVISSCSLLEAIADERMKKNNDLSREFDSLSLHDQFILLKQGIRNPDLEKGLFSGETTHDVLMVNLRLWSNSSIIQALNQFIAEEINHFEDHSDDEDPVVLLLHQAFLHCSEEQRASLIMLSEKHHSGLVLPLLFVTDKITSSEYVKGSFSLKACPASEPERNNILESFTRDAFTINNFLAFFKLQSAYNLSMHHYIKDGEGDQVEFKSTLRWDLKAGKTNQAIERACLKTVAAFLNTHGGTLLIGIRDDGTPEGIESDKFVNEDKFLLHLWTLIRTCLGRDVSPYVKTTLEKWEDRTVCLVHCSSCNRPVFLRQPGFNEEFYIRVGPGSTALDVSEALRYIADHFPVL
ncbi:MAG: ATP-binding protein [Bacteroidales bacterium]|nr:ATP-binding protein [Bacteroidales bacterium]